MHNFYYLLLFFLYFTTFSYSLYENDDNYIHYHIFRYYDI